MTEWITTKEAGSILGVSIRTIQRYVEKGKLKAKIVDGKNSVKKEAILGMKPTDKQSENLVTPKETHTTQAAWQIPEGYLLIDKSTLESLRDQIARLTNSVGEMQLTQKLLIEKGLNLKEDKEPEKETFLPEAIQEVREVVENFEKLPITDPIENVAKVHDEFFGDKKKGNKLITPLIVISVIIIILIIVLALLPSK